jgi:hypothetical protein
LKARTISYEFAECNYGSQAKKARGSPWDPYGSRTSRNRDDIYTERRRWPWNSIRRLFFSERCTVHRLRGETKKWRSREILLISSGRHDLAISSAHVAMTTPDVEWEFEPVTFENLPDQQSILTRTARDDALRTRLWGDVTYLTTKIPLSICFALTPSA